MIFYGARVALGPEEAMERELRLPQGRWRVDLSGYLVLPGLINAHDHLEFNLYPRLGHGPYANAGDWARDVYHPECPPISGQRRISKTTRLLWGGLKNLLCGVTAVCHHNPMEFAVFDRNFPVLVVKQFGWAHSLEYSPDLSDRFRSTPRAWPFVIHLGEGTDEKARNEIFRLDKMGALDDRTVLVHAVGLDRRGIELAGRKGASIVWCPSSNLFLLGRTLARDILESGIPIALGSDSALTAEGDLLDELRIAHALGARAASLYRMVTATPASILRLTPSPGDLAVFRDTGATPAETLLSGASPEMVIVGGRVKLLSRQLAARIGEPLLRFCPLHVEGRGEVLVHADVPGLYRRAARVLGEVNLAGKRTLPGATETAAYQRKNRYGSSHSSG
jgi:cytosine/adenosine deaminase-related metal-dependent hydrolase